jgi:hypothetical protein
MLEKRRISDLVRSIVKDVLKLLGLLVIYRDARARLDRELFTLKQNRLSREDLEKIYGEEYHRKANYGLSLVEDTGWEPDSKIKEAHARAILEVLPGLKKVLVGGCSSGMGVAAFRKLGIDAHGFEVSKDLSSIVLPEAKPYVVSGSMLEIPFGPGDGFDCFVTTDVLEHVQLKFVRRMFSEMNRLNTKWMAHLINHTSIQPDHMTLKPLSWWTGQAAPFYRLRRDLAARPCGNPRIYGLNGDPLHVYTFWERI